MQPRQELTEPIVPATADLSQLPARPRGWRAVVVFRVGDLLIAYPSNAGMGEFGLAVSMTLDYRIRAIAMW